MISEMTIPPVYQAGYEKARTFNPQLAAKYVERTVIDDPPADAAIEALANFSATLLYQATQLGAQLDAEARASFMQVWRYASWLMALPMHYCSRATRPGPTSCITSPGSASRRPTMRQSPSPMR